MSISSAMETALSQSAVTIFYAFKLELPDGDALLLDGAGMATFDGDTYTGNDALVGSLQSADLDGDGLAAEAPGLRLVVNPPSDAAAVALCSPDVQGATVTLYEGVLDPATGVVVADPDLKFVGEIDVPTLRVWRGARAVELEVVSIWDRLFDQEEGARLTGAFHESICPGEKAFEFVSLVRTGPVWGSSAPVSNTLTTAASLGTPVSKLPGYYV